jgi:hypothetical protein
MFAAMLRLTLAALVVLALTGCPQDASKKMEEKQRALDAAKEKKAKVDEAKDLAAPPKDIAKLGPPWEDSSYMEIKPDGKCPEGIWSLFAGDTPGGDAKEKKENEKKRGELSKTVKEATYLIKLSGPQQVTLKPYDAPKGSFPVEVLGTIDCEDSFGHVAIAWTKATAGEPPNSAAKQDADVTQSIWTAEPMSWALPMSGVTESKAFEKKNQYQLSSRIVIKLGKTEWNHKMKKVAKMGDKTAGISIGGGSEDWGAGRLVHAELVAVRVATNREKDTLFEKKP